MTQTPHASDHLDMEQLHAFIDGELHLNETRAIQQHLAECHSCALQVLSATQLKAATSRAAQRFVAAPDALARLAAQLRPQESKKIARIFMMPNIAWVGLAASIALAVSLLGWQQSRRGDALSAELLDQHLATLSSGAAPEVLSTDRHTVKPWFQGKLPFSFNLPDALPADMTLKGADFTYLNGKPAALLLFTIHKHEVSVFLTQRADSSAAAMRSGVRSGFVIHQAATRDLRIVAISDVNSVDLDLLLSALVQAQ